MSGLTDLLSAAGWCLFAIAANRLMPRFDRLLTLFEKGSVDQLPTLVRKLLGE